MVQDPKLLQCDILAPDDVVVLLDGTPKTVADSIANTDSLKTLNYRLFSIKPTELDDSSKVRQIMQDNLKLIESGAFDSMFSQAAILAPEPGVERLQMAVSIRDRAISQLQRFLNDQKSFDQLIVQGKKLVGDIRAAGFQATPNEQYEKTAEIVTSENSPITKKMERLFAAERIPIVIFSKANAGELHMLHDGFLKPTDAAHIYFSTEFIDNKPSRTSVAPLAFSQILMDQITSQKLGILLDAEVPKVGKVDQTKVRYTLERKRKEIEKHNKSSSSPILMFPDAIDTAKLNNNSPNPDREFDSNRSQLAELHHLLTYYNNDDDKAKIRDRFDNAQNYYSAIMQTLGDRIDARLNAASLPPPVVIHAEDDELHPKTPVTADEAIARADRFARANLPGHYKLRSYLQPTPDHRIAIKLTDDDGDTVEKVITLAEPDAERALDIKRRVQAHLMDIPGIVPYRGPMKEGSYHVGQDELVPASLPRSRISPRFGEYRVKLDWREPNEEMSIPLGLQYSADNHNEAVRRAEIVTQQLNEARQSHAGSTHLPLTKRDLIDHLRHEIQQQGGRWDERTHGEIDQFPAMLRFPFAERGHQQDSWLQIEELRTDGDPNYTWVLPINVVVDGQRLANASTHVNLHVRDRHAAEERAIETVNRLMQQINTLPRHTQWAIDPERPTHLLELSEAARNASPNLIDTNRLTDMQNELRSPFQKDLTIQVVGEPTDKDGKVHFNLGIVRGREHDVAEPVLTKSGDDMPPVSVLRRFAIAAAQREDIPRFVEAVNTTFRKVVGEEYDPRSAMNYDAEHLRKLKTPRPFKPNFAPSVFDRAIETHLPSFTDVTSLDGHVRRARSARPEAGFAGRINQPDDAPPFPG